jgi:hypothetical protein
MRRPALLALLATASCGRCTSNSSAPDAAPPAPTVVPEVVEDLLPPPAPWTFKPARTGPGQPSFALPEGCTLRAPLVRAQVAKTTRFVAPAQGLGALVVADVGGSPPELTGVAGLLLDPGGASREPVALPWTEAAAMPPIAQSAAGRWLAAYTEPGERENALRVLLFREGKAEVVSEGDRLEAIDLACGASRCALLTTRAGTVAAAGADLWIGKADEPIGGWKRVEIVPAAGESDAHPVRIARVDPVPIAVLIEGGELAFWQAEEGGGPREIGRVTAPFGMLDAAVLGEAPVALVYGNTVNEEGCAQEGGKMRFERPGKEAALLRAHAPPTAGVVRALGRGAVAAYLAPLGCGVERKVVYAVMLDAEGKPVGNPMPVADASSFAVAVRGEEVELFVQLEEEVTWVRAGCQVP